MNIRHGNHKLCQSGQCPICNAEPEKDEVDEALITTANEAWKTVYLPEELKEKLKMKKLSGAAKMSQKDYVAYETGVALQSLGKGESMYSILFQFFLRTLHRESELKEHEKETRRRSKTVRNTGTAKRVVKKIE
jgi:hypothetical protein